MWSRVRLPLLVVVMTIAACAAAAAAAHESGARAWHEQVLAPAQFDLSLAQVRFGAHTHVAGPSSGRSRRASSIGVKLRGSTGLEYVAAAVTRFSVLGRPRALVLVVNRRPRGSLAPDLARIGFTVTAPARLGQPRVSQISNPFTHPTGLTPALCDLPISGVALKAADLRSVLSRGLPLTGLVADGAFRFNAEAAIAEAYDAACGRPFSPLFTEAVTQGSVLPCESGKPNAVLCCQPNAMCLPPPCPPCPCGGGPCPAPVAGPPKAAIVCPLQSPPIACPL
jgi:hypothetical protein